MYVICLISTFQGDARGENFTTPTVLCVQQHSPRVFYDDKIRNMGYCPSVRSRWLDIDQKLLFCVFMDQNGVLLSRLKTTNLSFLTQVNIVSSHVRSNTQATTQIRRRLVTNIQPVTKLYTMLKLLDCTKPSITRNKAENLNKSAEDSERDIIFQFVIKELGNTNFGTRPLEL